MALKIIIDTKLLENNPSFMNDCNTESSLEALGYLMGRVLGPDLARNIHCEFLLSSESGERYEIEGSGDQVMIRGTSASAIARGFNAYIRQHLSIQYTWSNDDYILPERLPSWSGIERSESWATYRYFLNYCSFSYSMAYWDWAQWEKLIDWMALQGVNMPLAVTGQEAVWQRVCQRLGLTDAEIAHFLPGAAYLPFGWMGCLDGWSVPLSQTWIDQHEELGRCILARERSLGMTPVLQGFTGHIPRSLLKKCPQTKHTHIKWHDWETTLLDPMDPLFQKCATLFLEEQHQSFGTNHFYAADTFIEMVPPSAEANYLTALAKAIYEGMHARDPKAVWVLQSWAFSDQSQFWGQDQLDAFLGGVPHDRILILDLFCETKPLWRVTKAFTGKPWLWCNVQNFGGNTYLGAGMDSNFTGLREARQRSDAGCLVGLGFVNEALGVNPPAYDFLFDLAWDPPPVSLESWLNDYVTKRYHGATAAALAAWELLLKTVYARHETYLNDSPLTRPPSYPAVEDPGNLAMLCRAWEQMLKSAHALGYLDVYCFDLVNLGRQVLSDTGNRLKMQIQKAVAQGDSKAFESSASSLMTLFRDLDVLLATRKEFLLGPWIADARKWGTSVDESNLLEEEARRLITVWSKTRILRDYARKEWSGLLSDFHAGRWQLAIEWMRDCLEKSIPLNADTMEDSIFEWEKAWCLQHREFPLQTKGNSVEVSQALFAVYGAPFVEGGEA